MPVSLAVTSSQSKLVTYLRPMTTDSRSDTSKDNAVAHLHSLPCNTKQG